MNYLKISLGIFAALAASRFIPHPPNFTSLLALSFYIPAVFGVRYIPILILSFIITDVFMGFHSVILFTWGSVMVIGLMSQKFLASRLTRMSGAILGALIFFIITNFGVWTHGIYGYNFDGLLLCYTLALPFFTYSIISTIFYSIVIESVLYIFGKKKNYFFKFNG
jgi:hypothetical protein